MTSASRWPVVFRGFVAVALHAFTKRTGGAIEIISVEPDYRAAASAPT